MAALVRSDLLLALSLASSTFSPPTPGAVFTTTVCSCVRLLLRECHGDLRRRRPNHHALVWAAEVHVGCRCSRALIPHRRDQGLGQQEIMADKTTISA